MDVNRLIDILYKNDLKRLSLQEVKPGLFDINAKSQFSNANLVGNDYYCLSRNSQKILCCFGQSWTKGVGLEPNQHTDVFGAVVSKELNWDWVNAGGSGLSNSWILNNFEQSIDWLNSSNYESGVIMLTFTENARELHDFGSRQFDYISAYKDVPVDDKFYDRVLDDIEEEWISRLDNFQQKLDPRFKFIVGFDCVWHDRLSAYCNTHSKISYIKNRWIDLLADSIPKQPAPMSRLAILTNLKDINSIVGIRDETFFKHWFLKQSADSLMIIDWMRRTPEFFDPHDLGHPNAKGHQIWADILLEKIAHFVLQGSESVNTGSSRPHLRNVKLRS